MEKQNSATRLKDTSPSATDEELLLKWLKNTHSDTSKETLTEYHKDWQKLIDITCDVLLNHMPDKMVLTETQTQGNL